MFNSKTLSAIVLVIIIGVLGFYYYSSKQLPSQKVDVSLTDNMGGEDEEGEMPANLDPLTVETLRRGEYPGSDIVVEQTLEPGSNYQRYIVSYKSEGLKIYALLTVPNRDKPEGGWPVIIFNHGYIPPAEYRTTERYIAYTDGFSRNGYILLRPDYRGHGNSEGEASGAYGSNGYAIDVLNAVASMKKYKDANPTKIGMWGHSLGGFLTLRVMVVDPDIKAGVIWAGVVASYPDMLNNWRRGSFRPPPGIPSRNLSWRQRLVAQYGQPEDNPDFWASISANSYLGDISGPLQLHHGTADSSVPVEFSEKLETQMKASGKIVELYVYPEDDHNLSQNFNVTMQRSIEFFDKYMKPR